LTGRCASSSGDDGAHAKRHPPSRSYDTGSRAGRARSGDCRKMSSVGSAEKPLARRPRGAEKDPVSPRGSRCARRSCERKERSPTGPHALRSDNTDRLLGGLEEWGSALLDMVAGVDLVPAVDGHGRTRRRSSIDDRQQLRQPHLFTTHDLVSGATFLVPRGKPGD